MTIIGVGATAQPTRREKGAGRTHRRVRHHRPRERQEEGNNGCAAENRRYSHFDYIGGDQSTRSHSVNQMNRAQVTLPRWCMIAAPATTIIGSTRPLWQRARPSHQWKAVVLRKLPHERVQSTAVKRCGFAGCADMVLMIFVKYIGAPQGYDVR